MGYYEFTVKTADESRDALMQRTSAAGCLGMIENEKDIIAYFRDTQGINELAENLNSFKTILRESGLDSTLSFEYVFISERDWNESWKKKFKPIDVGDIFSVLPPWEEKKSGRINLVIDPGMAFGTGHHETTKTCLMLIEKLSSGKKKESFLDVGTGTGILAIAASVIGYKYVVGVDIDPLAVDASLRNVKLNNLDNIAIREGSVSAVEGPYDFIAANLMSEILIQIAPELAPRLNRSGAALLSGMLTGQEDGVITAMENCGLRFLEKFADGRWVSVALTR
ncbi:MAG: 50S ribosomal protein L11 methyltransferase [Nitrospirae bacterium]|nr:50S ribosomal protein L11 methyltransferase [Nitrospirota bacterium]MCL5236405.1 50S ribosomal protein L11 methyltransferase [Nitrospirota bacterium]